MTKASKLALAAETNDKLGKMKERAYLMAIIAAVQAVSAFFS
jgi:hypothetical protein